MVSKDYNRGFNAGYHAGRLSGLRGGTAAQVMKKDLIYVYGIFAMVATKHGWKEETVRKWLIEIQNEWAALPGTNEGRETMADYVKKKTGIDLEQMADYIVEEL